MNFWEHLGVGVAPAKLLHKRHSGLGLTRKFWPSSSARRPIACLLRPACFSKQSPAVSPQGDGPANAGPLLPPPSPSRRQHQRHLHQNSRVPVCVLVGAMHPNPRLRHRRKNQTTRKGRGNSLKNIVGSAKKSIRSPKMIKLPPVSLPGPGLWTY